MDLGISEFLTSLYTGLKDFLMYLLNFFFYTVYLLVTTVLNSIVLLLNSIPRPSFFGVIEQTFCNNLGLIGYFASQVNFSTPISMIMSAYVLRFIIRRIPYIG